MITGGIQGLKFQDFGEILSIFPISAWVDTISTIEISNERFFTFFFFFGSIVDILKFIGFFAEFFGIFLIFSTNQQGQRALLLLINMVKPKNCFLTFQEEDFGQPLGQIYS